MTMLLFYSAYAAAQMTPSHAKTGMLSEREIFEAASADLARTVRRNAATKRKAAVKSVLTKAGDFLFRAGREDRRQQELVEKLEAMPAYLLDDIGVTPRLEGQFLYVNDFGMVLDLMPAKKHATKTAQPAGPDAHSAFAAT
jgi:uncharacterized protein YjiS (DUF1127 family)